MKASTSQLGYSARFSVGIAGANGYAGLELARLLLRHPRANLKACFVRDTQWRLSQDLQGPAEQSAKDVLSLEIEDLMSTAADLSTVFLATPVEVSLEWAPQLASRTHVIDLSGAFRLRREDFEEFYHQSGRSEDLAVRAHYGLVPWNPSQGTSLVSNPGCFATSCLMALIPLLKSCLVDSTDIVIDAKSGTTGAGRKAKENLLFSEVEGDCIPYKVGAHQHLPEIKYYADLFSGQKTDIQLTTHLLPVRRGIISSIYLKRNSNFASASDSEFLELMRAAFDCAYSDTPLVRFGALDEYPRLASLRAVVGTPRTHISYAVKGNRIFVFSCVDNLLKGAASQAIENWNIHHLWPAHTGLEHIEGIL